MRRYSYDLLKPAKDGCDIEQVNNILIILICGENKRTISLSDPHPCIIDHLTCHSAINN